MTYLSFQQTYRLLIFEHCLGGNYLFIYLLWCPRYFLSKGKGGEKKEVLCQVLGKSDVHSSLLNYFLQSCCLKKKIVTMYLF